MNFIERKEFLKNKLIYAYCSNQELKELYFLIKKYSNKNELDIIEEQIWENQKSIELSQKDSELILKSIKSKI